MVGTTGFEPATPCTPSKCATRLRHVPTCGKRANAPGDEFYTTGIANCQKGCGDRESRVSFGDPPVRRPKELSRHGRDGQLLGIFLPGGEGFPSALDGEPLVVQEVLDVKDDEYVPLLVQPVAGPGLVGCQLGELLLPKAENVRGDPRDIAHLADLVVELFGKRVRLGNTEAGIPFPSRASHRLQPPSTAARARRPPCSAPGWKRACLCLSPFLSVPYASRHGMFRSPTPRAAPRYKCPRPWRPRTCSTTCWAVA